ncbi:MULTISPECIES: LysR family transcriptional regulator [Paraburkholderia]|jgi:DNA-binding transcriptional LysR family regulator|uniref:HTH-type transcriptional regulator HdfR n=1 Tax=Paraburkholderia aspalathi TaxID=1324617 RepID=A0ABM8QYX6_9BURK|nr:MULTISPECIES: LysR family transcriptional regulator [Paraburkholderia]MBK3818248.1 LysR family transcriptional regulator [Paraburkholderia aspalathi]MBK3830102.1 LysR family transcriptional regulator [Paraburkholderia aspalathi]MBK3859922.1 LysR family transcriptional regulator [Paraburkholderia aspalathi]MCX4137253.1 LysR family transcriptional regulator [Paraburkholderia aspalathi]MCX4153126.1 LysR family transcriptional regulator [Paraburkholderia aspalathi]
MMRELKTFLAVVRFGTFGNAGSHIGLTQSAVSAQIKRLEEDLGFPLFDRTGRSATLNEAGIRTAAVAEDLLRQYATLSAQAGDSSATGFLRIGAIASAQASLLVSAIQRFRVSSPGWHVRVVPGVSLNLLAQVDSGDVDAALIIKPPFALPAELKWHLLCAEPFVLLVPKKLAKTPWRELLASEPFIRYDRNSFGGRLVERFLRRIRVRVHDVVELDELQGIVGLVEQGVGIALIPNAASLHIPRGLDKLSLGEHTFSREIGLVERGGQTQRTAIAEFNRCVVEAAPGGRASSTTMTQRSGSAGA